MEGRLYRDQYSVARLEYAWYLRRHDATHREIGQRLGVSLTRARIMCQQAGALRMTEARMQKMAQIQDETKPGYLVIVDTNVGEGVNRQNYNFPTIFQAVTYQEAILKKFSTRRVQLFALLSDKRPLGS